MVINTCCTDSKLLGITLSLIVTLTACNKPQQEQAVAPQAIPVETQSLVTSKVTESSEYLGRIEADNRVNLASRVDGRVLDIAVQEGERVSKGQQIVQLQQSREQAEVNAAISQVSINQADLVNAEAQVKASQAEVARAEAQVGQSQADLRKQEAAVTLAQTNLERAKFLVQQGAESKQSLDNRTQELESAIAERDALKKALEASNRGLIAAQEGVSAAIANVDRQKATLNQAQANVGVASENLDYNRLTAPIDGIVGDIVPQEGDYVEAGQTITTITSNENLTINIGIPIEQASLLKTGLPVAIVGNRQEKPVMGEISFISPTTTQQSILVKATVPNNGRLQDAQSVLAKVIWSEKPGVLVPSTAISRIAGQNFVFVAEETQQNGETSLVAKQKVVQLGELQGQNYQVISGLEPGEQLITSGILNLTDGVPVTNEQVSMTEE
jgi:RND family efflux transporter MFP subunit